LVLVREIGETSRKRIRNKLKLKYIQVNVGGVVGVLE